MKGICTTAEYLAQGDIRLQEVRLAVARDFFNLAIAGLDIARHKASKIRRALHQKFHDRFVQLHVCRFHELDDRIATGLLDHGRQRALGPREFMNFEANADKRALTQDTDLGRFQEGGTHAREDFTRSRLEEFGR